MNWKIWLLIIAILASLLAIFPLDFTGGIIIENVVNNHEQKILKSN